MNLKPSIKYVVEPGFVDSATDGQRHYIGPMQLMKLYGVNPDECEIYKPSPWWVRSDFLAAEERHKKLIKLSPRFDGNYTIPTQGNPR